MPFCSIVNTMDEPKHRGSSDLEDIVDPLMGTPLPNNFAVTKRSRCTRLGGLVLPLICFVYIAVSAPALIYLPSKHLPKEPYSPASHVISYERQRVPSHTGGDGMFVGHSSDVDNNWHRLLEPSNIRTTKEELQQANIKFTADIVEISESWGGGYVSSLTVYHELHCLDSLRKNIFSEQYYANETTEEKDYRIFHMSEFLTDCRQID
ncbi:hypothetical protein F4777DRAFT_599790 [Nemania sp. FL0916]|nr:hypothetical protein F4777DRAFT_599790 [Nemania sp. FL0916]